MVNRPLKDKRIIGPLFGSDDDEQYESVSEDSQDTHDEDLSPIVEQAENWYRSISDERKKKKMMVQYIYGITDDTISKAEAERIVERSGL